MVKIINYLAKNEYINKNLKMLLEEMGDLIQNNKKKGLPVGAILINLKSLQDFRDTNDKATSKKDVYIVPKDELYKTHAEWIVLQKAKEELGIDDLSEWILISNIRPCRHCFDLAVNSNIGGIYYIYGNDKQDFHKIKHYKKSGKENLIEEIEFHILVELMGEVKAKQLRNKSIKPWKQYKSDTLFGGKKKRK